MEAEPPEWHFQAKPGNETSIGFLYCENDGRGIDRKSATLKANLAYSPYWIAFSMEATPCAACGEKAAPSRYAVP